MSARLLRTGKRLCEDAAALIDPVDAKYRVWASDDGTITCSVIPHAAALHEVAVLHLGHVEYCRGFHDPVEASDEAVRLRQVLLRPAPPAA